VKEPRDVDESPEESSLFFLTAIVFSNIISKDPGINSLGERV
jgi:hypothetical protein